VPHIEAARAVLWAVIALTAGWRAMSPAPLPPLGAVLDQASGTCVLGVMGSLPPCPCADTPAGLRRALGIPLPLDRASSVDLERIPGVGPRRAEAIVAERVRSGAYASPADLERVPGIGAKTAAALAPYLFTGPIDPACGTARGQQSEAPADARSRGAPPRDLTADVPALTRAGPRSALRGFESREIRDLGKTSARLSRDEWPGPESLGQAQAEAVEEPGLSRVGSDDAP
jgi:competence protein ComEA